MTVASGSRSVGRQDGPQGLGPGLVPRRQQRGQPRIPVAGEVELGEEPTGLGQLGTEVGGGDELGRVGAGVGRDDVGDPLEAAPTPAA